jgi:hypothetical protein
VKEQLGLDEEERLCMVTVIVGAARYGHRTAEIRRGGHRTCHT